jgi:DNA-directed RNA polymerase subunit M/transcription elongation factor TFIIS
MANYLDGMEGGKHNSDNAIASFTPRRKPKFYQTALAEIKGNVLDEVYPYLKGEEQLTMTERMGSEEAKCPECFNNEWWLLPADSVSVREGGKPYIECLNCGYQTHL